MHKELLTAWQLNAWSVLSLNDMWTILLYRCLVSMPDDSKYTTKIVTSLTSVLSSLYENQRVTVAAFFCWGNHFFIILCSPLCLLKWQNCLNSNNIFSESQFTHGMYCFNRSGKGVLSCISSVYCFSYLWIVSHSVWTVLFQFFKELYVLFKLDMFNLPVESVDCAL